MGEMICGGDVDICHRCMSMYVCLSVYVLMYDYIYVLFVCRV